MKRFLCVLLVFLMITPVLAEGIDLASLSFEELRILQTRISQEMTTRPEWKEVPVPPGLYQIGVDIPAGDWCITCDDSCFETHIDYGSGLNESLTRVSSGIEWRGFIYKDEDGENITFKNVRLIEGYYLQIEYGTAVFSNPTKKTLGF